MAFTAHGHWLWSARPAGPAALRWAGVRRKTRAGPVLEPHERTLAAAGLRDGGGAVATDRALIIGDAAGRRRRLAWEDIAEAAWSPRTASTVLRLWPAGGGAPERIELQSDRRFGSLAAERVAASRVMSRRVRLTETVAATVLATRTPGCDEVTWRVLLDDGRAGDHPDVAAAARRAVAELRALAGC